MSARSHVTKREAQAICNYAVELCCVMRMPTWQILVMEEPADDDAHANITWVDQRHVARLYLSTEWMTYSSDKRREIITHEVMHLLHSKVSTVVLDDSEPFMRDHEHTDWARRVRREFELMVDHLGTFMAATHTLEQAWDTAHTPGNSR